MPIEFLINFFGKLYLKNTIFLTIFFLVYSYALFHKQKSFLKEPEYFFSQFFRVFPLLVVIIFVINFFTPYNKFGALVAFAILNFIFTILFLFSGGLKSLRKEFLFFKDKDILFSFLKKFIFILSLSIFFSGYFNYSIFKVNTPFSWGINVDLYAHTSFINRLQNESFLGGFSCKNHACFFKNIVLSYPMASHSFVAFLDLIFPGSFVNKTDYGFILFGIFTASIVFLFLKSRNNLYKLVLILPLLFLPAFSIMLLRDHINSALFQVVLFGIYYYFLKFIREGRLIISDYLFLGFMLIAGWFIYHYSLVLSLFPLFVFFLGFLFFKILKNRGRFLALLYLLFIGFGVFFVYSLGMQRIAERVISLSKLQHIIDVQGFNLVIEFKNFLGIDIFPYNYFDKYKPIIFFQIITYIFWSVLLLIIFFSLLQYKRKALPLFFVLCINLLYVLILDYLWGYSYLQIRYYSYLATFLPIFVYFLPINKEVFKRKIIFIGIFLISLLTTRWFWILHMENQFYARANAQRNIGLDYIIPAFAMKESNYEKNILSFHIQDFNRAFVLFFPYKYKYLYAYDRWDGKRLVEDKIVFEKFLDFDKRNLGVINFENVDLLVVPVNFSYPKMLFDIVEQTQYAILLKKRVDFSNKTLFVDKEMRVSDFKKIVDKKDEDILLMKFYTDKNFCFYFIGDSLNSLYSAFSDDTNLRIEYLMSLKGYKNQLQVNFFGCD